MMMVQTRSHFNNPLTFARLMRLGQVAHAEGNQKAAFEYWSQAAMLEPDDEQVWTALMWVLERDEDRKVCLKNILAINPNNLRAQEMLDDLIGETQPQTEHEIFTDTEAQALPPQIDFLRVIVLSLILGSGSSMIVVLIQILLR